MADAVCHIYNHRENLMRTSECGDKVGNVRICARHLSRPISGPDRPESQTAQIQAFRRIAAQMDSG